jgi:hypothetical protein
VRAPLHGIDSDFATEVGRAKAFEVEHLWKKNARR